MSILYDTNKLGDGFLERHEAKKIVNRSLNKLTKAQIIELLTSSITRVEDNEIGDLFITIDYLQVQK